MINQRDRDIVEREVGKMVVRSEIQWHWFDWDEMHFDFTIPWGDYTEHILIEGDTVDEMVEAIRLGFNQILEDMRNQIEASKLDYKFGKGGVTV